MRKDEPLYSTVFAWLCIRIKTTASGMLQDDLSIGVTLSWGSILLPTEGRKKGVGIKLHQGLHPLVSISSQDTTKWFSV